MDEDWKKVAYSSETTKEANFPWSAFLWDEMLHRFDPIAFVLIKSSLGEPSWIDSDEYYSTSNASLRSYMITMSGN